MWYSDRVKFNVFQIISRCIFSPLVVVLLLFAFSGNSNAKTNTGNTCKRTALRFLKSESIKTIKAAIELHPDDWIGADQRSSILLNGSHRADLEITDFVDQLENVSRPNRFQKIRKEIIQIINSTPLERFGALISYFEENEKSCEYQSFFRALNRKTVSQEFNLYGVATVIPFNPIRNQHIQAYNQWIHSPFGPELQQSYFIKTDESHWTRPITVTKFSEPGFEEKISTEMKFFRENYLHLVESLRSDLQKNGIDLVDADLKIHDSRPSRVSYRPSKTADKVVKDKIVPLLNAIETVPYRQDLLLFLDTELRNLSPEVKIQTQDRQFVLTPEFIRDHFDAIVPLVKDYTYKTLLFTQQNDDILLKFRHWVRSNATKIQDRLREYNLAHSDKPLQLSYTGKGIVHRHEVFEDFASLETLFPDAPWMNSFKASALGPDGGHILLGKSRFSQFMHNVGRVLKDTVRPENIAGSVAGIGITLLTGNAIIGGISSVLVRESLDTIIHDRGLKDGFKDVPGKLAIAAITASPFTGGHFVRLFATGAIAGGLQSLVTGQNVFYGALVGGTFETVGGFLPEKVAHPGPVLTKTDLKQGNFMIESMLWDLGSNTLKRSAQGAVVAGISHENIAKGAGKGALFGLGEGAIKFVLLGRSFRLGDLYTDEQIQAELDKEDAYQNSVGQGVYDLTVDEVKDADWRVGGLLNTLRTGNPSSTTLGNLVANPIEHMNLGTMGHESSHISQQDHFGYLGFYSRYFLDVPTCDFFGTAYGGCNRFEHYGEKSEVLPEESVPGNLDGANNGVIWIPVVINSIPAQQGPNLKETSPPNPIVFGDNPLVIESR